MSDPTPIREHKTAAGRVYQLTEFHNVMIDWNPPQPIGGHRILTRGEVRKHPSEGRVVSFFEQIKVGRKSQIISARLNGRPDLTELADIYEAWEADIVRENKAKAAEQKRIAAEARVAKVAAFKETLPEGFVSLDRVDHNPSAADGWGLTEYHHGGHKLNWKDVSVLGPQVLTINEYDLVVFVHREGLDALIVRLDAERAAKQAAKATKEGLHRAKVAELAAKAALTGEPQVLNTWVTDRCYNGNDDECSFDAASEVIMPDGTRKTEYVCCY